MLLQQTDAYKQRFKANDARIKAGMRALSPAEYLGLESSYRQILSSYGLPKGFYDSTDDFTNWIAGDVAPTEIENRVQLAVKATAQADPYYKQAMQELGFTQGDMYATFLDRNKALPLLQNAITAADVKSSALQQGLDISNERALAFGQEGVSRSQAQQDFQQVRQVLPEGQRLASIYGMDYTQNDAEDEFLGGLASARRKRQQLIDQEQANFAGTGGQSRSTLTQNTSGAF